MGVCRRPKEVLRTCVDVATKARDGTLAANTGNSFMGRVVAAFVHLYNRNPTSMEILTPLDLPTPTRAARMGAATEKVVTD